MSHYGWSVSLTTTSPVGRILGSSKYFTMSKNQNECDLVRFLISQMPTDELYIHGDLLRGNVLVIQGKISAILTN